MPHKTDLKTPLEFQKSEAALERYSLENWKRRSQNFAANLEEHSRRIVISLKLLCNFIEMAIQHGCSPVNLLHILEHFFIRTPMESCF